MKQIVGVADMIVSNNPEESVITYSLGSCIGLVIYDPTVKVGGILHYMLPESSIDADKARRKPYMFADTGIPAVANQLLAVVDTRHCCGSAYASTIYPKKATSIIEVMS